MFGQLPNNLGFNTRELIQRPNYRAQ